jgi:hypothetical protein
MVRAAVAMVAPQWTTGSSTSDTRVTGENRWVTLALSAVYILLALVRLTLRFRDTGRTFKDGIATPFDKLGGV